MRIQKLENGKILIDRDEALLAKIEGESLDGVDVSDLRICAESVSQLYLAATTYPSKYHKLENGEQVLVEDYSHIKRYVVMKQKYLETFSK